ncbi:hypothetical protein C1N80_06265 [Brachybacterium sp. SGAir0954]|nr:hypothetical protein C1N80_06265 [Brachybacterium sp. SGAir0954]
MYEFGLDDAAAHAHLTRALSTIDHITNPDNRSWLTTAPAPGSEVDRLEQAVLQDPVDLSHSLGFAATAALDSLQEIAIIVRGNASILTPLRGMMRTALMGAGRVGYVILPDSPEEREAHAGMVVSHEAVSLGRALASFGSFTELPGLAPTPDELAMLLEQIQAHPRGKKEGEAAMIQASAELVARAIAEQDPAQPAGVLAEQLAYIWNTASGAAHGFYWQHDFEHGSFVADLGAVVSAVYYSLDALRARWE